MVVAIYVSFSYPISQLRPVWVPPIDPVSITGYIIQLQWQRPTGNTGLLTHYVLSAYNQDLPDIAPVQTEFTDTAQAENSGKHLLSYTSL